MLYVGMVYRTQELPENQWALLLRYASEERRARALRYRRRQDAENCLLAEVLGKMLLEECFGLPLALQQWAVEEQGKPYVKNADDRHFSLSHSGLLVACAASSLPVGIDIQTPQAELVGLARRFFTQAEADYVLLAPPQERPQHFCRVWTRKESYVKRSGEGLFRELASFDVLALQEGAQPIFWEYWMRDGTVCSVCCSQPQPRQLFQWRADILIRCYLQRQGVQPEVL